MKAIFYMFFMKINYIFELSFFTPNITINYLFFIFSSQCHYINFIRNFKKMILRNNIFFNKFIRFELFDGIGQFLFTSYI